MSDDERRAVLAAIQQDADVMRSNEIVINDLLKDTETRLKQLSNDYKERAIKVSEHIKTVTLAGGRKSTGKEGFLWNMNDSLRELNQDIEAVISDADDLFGDGERIIKSAMMQYTES